ncbi:MAG TPA: heme peroxidase family protein [Gemmatimonadales bacterium]|nr:heme peroxidase family protein [Gemmatimonadales bacterium]
MTTTNPVTHSPVPHHCLGPSRASALDQDAETAPTSTGAYRRMFPELPPLPSDEAFLRELGTSCGAEVSKLSPNGKDDASGAAGWPFLGQFIAHDVTADRSALVDRADIEALKNVRRQKLNLEFLYGSGSTGDPYLYDVNDPAKLLIGLNDAGQAEDLQRNAQGIAIIVDPRNDSHLLMAQMQVLFSKFHNRIVDWLRETGTAEHAIFAEAQRLVVWHYQWIILREFLPEVIGGGLTDALLAGGSRYYRPAADPFIPLEFADAAYRYGHGQLRESYRVNAGDRPVPLFPDLVGFRAVPASRVVDWAGFFDLPGRPPAQRAKKLDGRLCSSIMHLPQAITGDVEVEAFHSLAARDLQRGHAVGLPSGEAIARHIGATPLTREQTALGSMGWDLETPLWYYVLKESEVQSNGDRLGEVGGRIVGEVLVGLLDHDPSSFRASRPNWRPELPSHVAGKFTMADLLGFVVGKRDKGRTREHIRP